MPKHLFTIAALGHSVDVQTNMLSLFTILESITLPTALAAIPHFVIATVWAREEDEEGVTFIQRVSLITPGGDELVRGESSFRLDKRHHRNFITIVNPRFEDPGTYTIKVSVRREDEEKWAKTYEYPLEIDVAERPEEAELFGAHE